jgi:hypothetical protein
MRHPNQATFEKLFDLLMALEVITSINQDVGSTFDHINDTSWLENYTENVRKTFREFKIPLRFSKSQRSEIEKHKRDWAFWNLEAYLVERVWMLEECKADETDQFRYLFLLDTIAEK